MSKNKLALVTGASGYIAKHIIVQLLRAGWDVRGSVRNLNKGQRVLSDIENEISDVKDIKKRLNFVALDLGDDAGWDDACIGVDAVLHTASPFPIDTPKDENDLIRPAVDGALRALKAARNAGVQRVVLTSSTAAVVSCDLPAGKAEYNEEDWTDVNHPTATAYVKSKAMAERAAWDFVQQTPEMRLTVINPGFVQGRPIGDDFGTSVQVIQRILRAKDSAMPDLSFMSVDVRDIALMHVRALERPDSVNKRILGVDRLIHFVEIAQMLKTKYPNRKIVTRKAPFWLLRILGLFDAEIRSILPQIGIHNLVSNDRAKDVLGIEFRDVRQSIVDTADYLIEKERDK